jgi:hypothetical protein
VHEKMDMLCRRLTWYLDLASCEDGTRRSGIDGSISRQKVKLQELPPLFHNIVCYGILNRGYTSTLTEQHPRTYAVHVSFC